MANTKISNESAATTLTGSELVLGVQSSDNVKITVDQIVTKALTDLTWKKSVVAATTVDGTMSTAFANGQVIDGVTLTTGDRILIKDQSTASQNGIYVVPAAGTPARAADAADGVGFANASVFVSKGTAQADTQWVCTTDGPITLGTTGLVFAQPGGGGGGGGVALTFLSDTSSTADADGSNGTFRWDNATQASATVLFFDNLTNDGVSTTTLFAALPTASGLVMITDALDSTKWQIWQWSAVTAGSGYYKFPVTLLASSGSIADARLLQTLFIPLGGGGSALTYFAESTATASPNNTINTSQLLAVASSSAADLVIAPKSSGAILRQVPNNSASQGVKRGQYAVDLQGTRASSIEVASGAYSVIAGGYGCKASNSYSVVAGGQTNYATASNSSVGGGFTNTASGTYSHVGGGASNTASGAHSGILSGSGNSNAGPYASVCGGFSNTITSLGTYGVILGGSNNNLDAVNSTVMGSKGKTYSINGVVVHSTYQHTAAGDSQRMCLVVQAKTTNATVTPLVSDANSATFQNQLTLQDNSSMTVTGQVVARQTSTGDTKTWTFTAAVRRGANAAATAMVASCTPTVVAADAGASAWTIAVGVNTTHGCVKLEVTGEASKNIAWVASLDAVQVVY